MKALILLVFCLFAYSALAKVNLKVDYSFHSESKHIAVSKDLILNLDEVVLVDLPGQKEKLEVNLTNRVPASLNKKEKVHNAVVINMRLLDFSSGEEVVLASPKVMAVYGSTAELETSNNSSEKMKLVLTANQL